MGMAILFGRDRKLCAILAVSSGVPLYEAYCSKYHDLNSETDALEIMQRERTPEAKELDNCVREGCGGVSTF